jgi:outer membrane receptor for ferric coprogen and ferric-rhodotorulic acid
MIAYIPQSISVRSQQYMKDKNLQAILPVLTRIIDVTAQVQNSDCSVFYSRGFLVSNFVDGAPLNVSVSASNDF